MLRIYTVALRVAADAADAADRIGRKDPDLARQLRRAAASTPLNIAEGAGSLGKNRRARYANALGSATNPSRRQPGRIRLAASGARSRVPEVEGGGAEVAACFDVAVAMRCIPDPGPDVRQRLDHVIGTLVNLTR